ncbi:MAG: F0F1 ATP synthase subunit delta [Bacteroidales bacterium]|nr:F0F1 ATP synthase subunit delta [Bacteroidales bacterium]MDE6537275.1 F0F1 ATP synthase subunit delta [Muribaculaceae bacterium]MDE6835534.1 F0F1 ATP synthase subunit delta [Muribaculaceae bacterium]
MISGLIPQRYAKALYKFALETKSAGRVYEEMKNVITSFQQNPELSKVLSNPFVEPADKERLLISAAGKNPGEDYKRFVKLILDHKREEFAYLMAYAYRDIYRKANNISQVKIVTAVKLDPQEMKKLHDVVEKSFKDTTFEYSEAVDPEIIGGFIIDVDSVRMDASISNELEQLRHNLIRSN